MSKSQIFCFTYAGGTKNFFDVIENDLKDFELVKLEYAGHGERHKEGYYNDFDELAEDMLEELKEKISGEYSLFGYSMGSITLVEVLKRILKEPTLRNPTHLFLAAHEPHTKSELLGFTDNELDDWVKKRTIKFGAVPERLLNNKVFWRTYLPLYRADYTIIGKYKFEMLDLRTTIPTTIFYSETDTPRKDMDLWRKYFIGKTDYHQYSGTHFFIQEHHGNIADVIKKSLMGANNHDI